MKHVKLIAKPNTWFKEGTEVYHYDVDYSEKRRLTLDEWNLWVNDPSPIKGVLVRGIHVYENGEELPDGEWCSLDEFNVEIV